MSTLKSVEKLGRQAWLASLGAYGSGWKYAVNKFDQTYTKTNEMVNELISEGEKVEAELQEKLQAKALLDSKITALKAKLGLTETNEAEQLDLLSAKVDTLTIAVSQLVEKRLAEKEAKTTKSTAKKAPAKTAKS